MIVEPDIVHGKHLRLARLFWRRFFRVLTKNPGLLGAIPNGLHLPFGFSFIADPDAVDCTKSRLASLIASAKQQLPGHKLRHQIVAQVRARGLPVEVMGRGYRPFAEKSEGLAPYRYSVVIENIREPSYFTEKIVDACLCETVPIYWGAPDIARYFDPEGVIACESAAEMLAALATMSEQDYARRRPAIARNKALARDYADLHGRAARAVLAAATEMAEV
jgi:hypothetical protein